MSSAPTIEHDIRAALFDFDDTMIPSRRHVHRHLGTLASRHGFDYRPEKLEGLWGHPGNLIVQQVFNMSPEEADEHYPKWSEIELEAPAPLFHRTRVVLHQLREANVPLGIVTNRSSHGLSKMLKRKRLHRYFDPSLTHAAEKGRPAKPDPRVFDDCLRVLGEMGIKPHNVAYIGDGDKDVHAAVGAGLFSILVETGDHHSVTEIKPHARFPTVAHAGDWILGNRR